jgi:hypothetical protein
LTKTKKGEKIQKMKIPYILTDRSLTIVLNDEPKTITSENPVWNDAITAIREGRFSDLPDILDKSKAIARFSHGKIEVRDGLVTYAGEEIHNIVVDRILNFIKNGLPYEPLVKFLDKLMANPSRRAVNELYKFLEHKKMPLTPDGDFLAYKSVRSDFTDWYSGKHNFAIGQVREMARNQVCDNADVGCSAGYHAGSEDYAKSFNGGGNLVIVKINPADVVSVPTDCECQKLRASKLEVVALYRKSLDKELYDIAYGNFIHPYRPEAIEAMQEMYDVDPDDEYDDEDEEDDVPSWGTDGTLKANYHNKRDPHTGRFIKG